MNKTVVASIGIIIVGILIGYSISDKDNRFGHFNKNDNSKGYQMRGGFDYEGYGMSDTGGHMMHMSVSSEKEFIEEMIPHHQEAVDTAKEVIERGGTTPEIKKLVENIVIAQEKEIADMKEWYKSWYGEDYVDTNTYQPMMRELENLSGAELDRVFLQDMIMHHMGAIMMARSVGPYIEHQEIRDLSSAIISSQSEEIALMRLLLQNL